MGVRADIARTARKMSLAAAEEITTPGRLPRRVFFPVTAVLSLLVGLRSGQRAEYGTVGREGLAGIPAILGADEGFELVVVETPGDAWVIDAGRLERLAQRHAALRNAMRAHLAHAFRVAAQSTVCVAYHPLEQRLARWLLELRDRERSDEFPMTHEILAHMVAATRPRVSEAAARLRARRIIDYRAGRLQIRDRRALEAAACECYAATRR